MDKIRKHVIAKVYPDSIAEEMELSAGDALLMINGQEIEDVFDYRFLMNDEIVTVLIEKPTGEQWELEIEKEAYEDLGVEFENSLMDEYRSCSNHCIFCFIDQMPPGMRETLYFKDDDSRLSFLQGNYVTLTNMSEHDLDRIIRYHMEPINISFQTMDPALRCKMLHNRFAGDALKKAQRLYEAGITMNGQIVLCKGVNDGEALEFSLQKLSEMAPVLQSVSIVPVGLTRFREGLYPLEPFDREDAKKLLQTVHAWQKKLMDRFGIHFVHASDEWYILAGEELPPEESYDGYLQLENGVGMLRLMETEVKEALSGIRGDDRDHAVTIATGCLAAPFIEAYAALVQEKFPRISVHVRAIVNHFFGETITVAGLVTGQDLIAQLTGLPPGERVLIPSCMLRDGDSVFLDDITVEEAEEKLQTTIEVTGPEGSAFVRAVADLPRTEEHRRRQIYEQTGSGYSGET